MAVSPELVRVAVTGAVSKGPLDTTAPTSSSSAITGFDDLGAISEDGVALSLPDSGDATPIKIWQNGATVRTIRESSDDLPEITFTMVETSAATIETYFGAEVTPSTADGSFEYSVVNREPAAYVLDVIDGAELIRLHFPRGVVSSVGEITLANTEAIGYEVTIQAEFDSTAGYNFKSWLTALKTPA